MLFKKVNYKLFFFLFLFLNFCFMNVFCESYKQFIKKEILKKQKEFNKKKFKPSGPKVAFIPFDFTSEVGEESAKIALNEVAISMLTSGKFQPYSLKEWMDSKFYQKKGRNHRSIR